MFGAIPPLPSTPLVRGVRLKNTRVTLSLPLSLVPERRETFMYKSKVKVKGEGKVVPVLY
jgi:hypothetical protein